MFTPVFLHYSAVATATFLSVFGTGIGQGLASASAIEAMSRQPMGSDQTFRSLLIGLALVESGCVFAILLALMLLAGDVAVTFGAGLAEMGLALSIGLSSCVVGLASSFAISSSAKSIVREPFFAQRILTFMLLTQSIIEAPVIFAFIIALIIKTSITPDITDFEGLKLFSAGLMIGVGAIGPAIGQAIFAKNACRAIGINKDAYRNIFSFSLLSEAVIETPVIFALLLSLLIIYIPGTNAMAGLSALAATISMGIGAVGTGIANGYVASQGCEQIALNEKAYPSIFRASLLSQAIIEASVIYSFIVALILITRA